MFSTTGIAQSRQFTPPGMPRFTQSNRLLRLYTPLGDNTLLAESLHGEESLESGFCLHISALSTDASLSLRSLLGQPLLLQLVADAGNSTRAFHGHVTAAEICGANGGLARYKLTVEPWTAFLGLGRDSRIFQDKSVLDIVNIVFGSYLGKGKLAPAWRLDVDRSRYPQRSLVTQYQESDLAFVERLMSEEGLFSYFEHDGAPTKPARGSHTMVIADSNDVFMPNAQEKVRFTKSGASMTADSVDRWSTESRLLTNAIELCSWDYRIRGVRTASVRGGGETELRSADAPGSYAFASREHGRRIVERQLQALESSMHVHTGAGTVRTFAPGRTFTLSDHSKYDGNKFLIMRVRHLAHNNLNAEIKPEVIQGLGQDPVAALTAAELSKSLHTVGKQISQRPDYRNSFDAIGASVPYRNSRTDGNGRLLHPRPTVQGQQTAIVVGPPGTPVYTDRDHRIKIQFHWQRGRVSHSRLEHPNPDGHTGAPGNEQAGTWVRVATSLAPIAGGNWGSNSLPRVGQEVLVDFLDGDIDRPVVIGALYNGRGAADAQHNQFAYGAGVATGNAGMWFPGDSGAHAHPAVLSGIKSQALKDSASGIGEFSQLVFDDSPGQARVSLQRHAKPHAGTAELNLGHSCHQTDNKRISSVGFGAELKTEHSLALRAGRGMLLSGDRAPSSGQVLESGPAAIQVEQSHALQQTLVELAQKHGARLGEEPSPEKIRSLDAMTRSAQLLRPTSNAAAGEHGPGGKPMTYSEPQLQLSAPSGIAALTPAAAIITAGTTTSIVAEQDINFAAQGRAAYVIKDGISLFSYGKVNNTGRPVQETGIRLHAANGKVSSQSQSGETRLIADKTVTIASVTKNVKVAAKEHLLLTAQGAYIKLTGGNIEIHAPGKVAFKATMKELSGPQNSSLVLPALPKGQAIVDALEPPIFSQQVVAPGVNGLTPEYEGMPYQVWKRGKRIQVASGTLDENGKSARVFTDAAEDLTVIVGDASWEVIVPIDNEPSLKGDAGE